MIRSKDQQKKSSSTLPDRKENRPYRTLPLDFAMITQSNFWELCDKRILNAKAALYLYTMMRSTLATGISHRIYYDEVARDTGFDVVSIYRAAQKLEEAGLIERHSSGYYTCYTPALAAQAEIKEHRQNFRREQRFWTDLNKEIKAEFKKNKYNSENLPHISIIHAIHNRLVLKRENRKTHNYVPPEEGTAHILPNLIAHTSPNDRFHAIYLKIDEIWT